MKSFIILIFFVFLFYSCSNSTDSKPKNEILGSWTETFHYQSINMLYPENPDTSEWNRKTSTLNFNENGFTLKVLPEEYRLDIVNDSFVYRLSFDTLVVGTYTIKGDMLTFYLQEDDKPHIYKYEIENYSLSLNAQPIPDPESNFMVFRSFDFLWGNTIFKYGGKFKRN